MDLTIWANETLPKDSAVSKTLHVEPVWTIVNMIHDLIYHLERYTGEAVKPLCFRLIAVLASEIHKEKIPMFKVAIQAMLNVGDAFYKVQSDLEEEETWQETAPLVYDVLMDIDQYLASAIKANRNGESDTSRHAILC
ncbi:MAG: hypothetical protein Q9218_002560 [Villophora microphyllina]